MRRSIALFLALLAMASPALAGSKAVYEGMNGPPLVIEVGDNGTTRIGPQGKDDNYGLLIDSSFYLVSHEGSQWKVARIADQAAAFDRVLPPIFRNIFSAAASGTNKTGAAIKMAKSGSRTVAGIPGEVYTVTGLNSDKPTEAKEVVVTKDPKLAPVGRAVAGFNDAMMVMMAPLLGKMAADEVGTNHAMAALGTPLEIKDGIRLTSFAETAVDPARLVLPARPMTVDQIVAGMKVKPTTGN
jgi:hypothetical protein